jgi:hypothetical protein
MAKPRTNDQTCEYWAKSILTDSPAPAIQVNSIIVRNDTVFSFGSHYPMGVIVRDPHGRPKRVLLNSDWYPSRGFANTPGDQASVRAFAHSYANERGVPVVKIPLSAFSTNGNIRVRPREDDPEPPSDIRPEVPRRFVATNPGPEPVKDPHGCVAGHLQVNGVMVTAWVSDESELQRNDRPKLYTTVRESAPNRARGVVAYLKALDRYSGPIGYPVTRPGVERIEWVEATYYWPREDTPERKKPNWEQRQCPHCAKFEKRHSAWTSLMRGGYGVRGGGWLKYQECLERYGGWDGWLEAWREDRDHVRAARQAHAEWYDRNHVPLEYVKTERTHTGQVIPRTDSDGYAYRKDAESYWKLRRAAERDRRRAAREAAERERKRRAFERFKNQINSKRPVPFRERAAEVAEALRAINPNNATVPPNDSQEVSD